MPALRGGENPSMEIALRAAEADVAGVMVREGHDPAKEVMRQVMQLMVARGFIINWRGLRVTQESVVVQFYTGGASMAEEVAMKTGILKPENVIAVEVMCT